MGINKQQMLDFLSQPEALTEPETEGLETLVLQYPYFQLAYSLIAKSKHDRQTPDAYQALSIASIYAPDRRVLKKLFYDNLHIEPVREESVAALPAEDADLREPDIIANQEEVEEEISEMGHQQTSDETEDIETSLPTVDEDTTISDENNKNQPQEINTYDEEEPTAEIIPEPESPNTEEDLVANNETVYDELQTNLEKLKKSRLKYDDESDDESDDEIEESTEKPSGKKKTVSKNSTQESSVLLENLTHLSDKNQNLGSKQIEQIEIIDKFISSDTHHTIVLKDKKIQNTETPNDLSETSTAFKDSPVTENFAVIMEKQGKIEKAIEIYRKLIWKFPQKKTYFADKIKELTEKE